MRYVPSSHGSTWTLWAVMASAAALTSIDGFEGVGLSVWLLCVTVQWVVGLTTLFRRRRSGQRQ